MIDSVRDNTTPRGVRVARPRIDGLPTEKWGRAYRTIPPTHRPLLFFQVWIVFNGGKHFKRVQEVSERTWGTPGRVCIGTSGQKSMGSLLQDGSAEEDFSALPARPDR